MKTKKIIRKLSLWFLPFHSFFRKALLLLFVIVFVSGLLFFLRPVYGLAKIFFLSANPLAATPTIKSTDGKTNILLLGVGGKDHEGALLTDSIIVASVDEKTKKVLLVSVPRDIWLESLPETVDGSKKINTAYASGEVKKAGGGLILAKAAAAEILGIPIHYGAVIDFAGFQKAIDIVGGVDIEVENAFDDYRYPIPGKENEDCGEDPDNLCRYEHLHFDKGVVHMSGELALKYVRSRYAEGIEGNDFARSKRQQKLLLALKNKIFSRETLFSPEKINNLQAAVQDSIDTDIDANLLPYLLKQVPKIGDFKVESFSLEESLPETPESLFTNPPVEKYGMWVLVPKKGDFTVVHQKIKALTDSLSEINPGK
ncbi:MAG: LCP family protein [bacterium]|nr:LCP family protein [bacterium]